mmetsp:Transcript_23157/g.28412  ORF Transcript_23157/g.28412 Transcript_23157/m.28412 type:complete len:186 (-) Transcript_23157:83-640(-)
MDGAGIPICPDWVPGSGPPKYQNVPPGYLWTIDGNPAIGINVATPGMGLHGLDVSELAPGRDSKDPYLLMLNYDKEVIGNHIIIWSGFAKGEHPTGYYEKTFPEYNCQSLDKNFLPTKQVFKYDEVTRRTRVVISGPLQDCSGESFIEKQTGGNDTNASKSSKTHKSTKALRSTKCTKATKRRRS